VSHHSGSTSAAAGGCDGVVVPTLIDWQTGEVIVDSKRICLHLDAQMPEAARLRPRSLADAIDAELSIVDNLPNYQMLMGRRPSASEDAATKSGTGGSFSQRKVAWCDHYLQEHTDEAALVQAYTAKRAKELSAATELFTPEAMQAAYDRAAAALKEFERKLEQGNGRWLFGETVTMADLFWSIELLRMKNTGVATYWEEGRLPHVEQFAAAGEALRAVRAAVIDWPGAVF
jgi:2,5-dichlorohydroquinone reductive dechlorinase